jgi:hypothetical protein
MCAQFGGVVFNPAIYGWFLDRLNVRRRQEGVTMTGSGKTGDG